MGSKVEKNSFGHFRKYQGQARDPQQPGVDCKMRRDRRESGGSIPQR